MQNSILTVSKHSEFFIALCQRGQHSSIMLGVNHESQPELLGIIGKSNFIDPDFNNTCKIVKKTLTSNTLAVLNDANLTSKGKQAKLISYQAYAINYAQLQEFLSLIAYIEINQIQDNIIGTSKSNNELIKCYVPDESKDNIDNPNIKFTYRTLPNLLANATDYSDFNVQDICNKSKFLNINNTCRHTSLDILRTILGFKTDISENFLIKPAYKTTRLAGVLNKETFCILPHPPGAFKDLSDHQLDVLTKLYRRIQEIPKKDCFSAKTKAKFDALKATYVAIAGKNNLSAGDLLITIWDEINTNSKRCEDLFARRNTNFFSKFITGASATEKMFMEINTKLNKC